MFCLTSQERKVVLFLSILILAGSTLRLLTASDTTDKSAKLDNLSASLNIPASVEVSVDINKASSEELKSIPGIGEVTARRIINYRSQFGPFKNLDELKKVKGIGSKKIEIIKKYISF